MKFVTVSSFCPFTLISVLMPLVLFVISLGENRHPFQTPKKNTSHGNEVPPQNTTHLIQRSCHQWGSPCQDLAGNWTTWRPSDDRKETQTALVWSCLPFIRSGQNHLARHSEGGKRTRQTQKEMGRQHWGMDRPGDRQVPESSGEHRNWRRRVAKSSVVPQQPLQVRGRWDERGDKGKWWAAAVWLDHKVQGNWVLRAT